MFPGEQRDLLESAHRRFVFRRRAISTSAVVSMALPVSVKPSVAEQNIGGAEVVANNAWSALSSGRNVNVLQGDAVFRDAAVGTDTESTVKFFLRDSTSLSLGPSSSIKLDCFICGGPDQPGSIAVNLVKRRSTHCDWERRRAGVWDHNADSYARRPWYDDETRRYGFKDQRPPRGRSRRLYSPRRSTTLHGDDHARPKRGCHGHASRVAGSVRRECGLRQWALARPFELSGSSASRRSGASPKSPRPPRWWQLQWRRLRPLIHGLSKSGFPTSSCELGEPALARTRRPSRKAGPIS